MKLKISYFNCTANQAHIGYYAVTDAHLRMLLGYGYDIIHISMLNDLSEFKDDTRQKTLVNLENSYINKIILESDAIVINGEGTIHHNNGLVLLSLAELSLKLSKPTFLVNAVIESIDGYDDILKKLDDLNVRDLNSSNYLANKNIKHRLVLDSILEANFNQEKSICLKDKIVFTDWHPQRDLDVGSQIIQYESLKREEILYLPIHHLSHIENARWRGIVSSLSEAKLIITGRHHGLYLAGLAGIPIVVLPSNTYKIEGLVKMLPFEIAFCKPNDSLEEKIEYALNNSSIAKKLQKWLHEKRPLTTFDGLYKLLPSAGHIDDIELENKITELFQTFIQKTIENEIKSSYKNIKLRVHNKKLINSLKDREKKLLQRVNIFEERTEKLRDSYTSLRERYKNLHENSISTKKQLVVRNETIKKLQKNDISVSEEDFLIKQYMYEEWLKLYENEALLSTNEELRLHLAMSYHGVLEYDKALEVWNILLTSKYQNIAKKNIARIYIELNKLDNKDIFESWNEKFAFYLAKKDFFKAWSFILKRPKTKKLLDDKKHLFSKNNENNKEKILILPDGGIGDEVRNSIIYKEIHKLYPNIVIACENRLYNLFRISFPYIDFIIYSSGIENDYKYFCSIYDLFHKVLPEDAVCLKKSNILLILFNKKKYAYLKIDSNLEKYWKSYLYQKAKGKKIIGICQGSHIHSFDRISNIFSFELWKDFLSSDYLYVNLSFEYVNKDNLPIFSVPIDYKNDINSLAVVINSCNIVITPANTILDIAGALGKKTIALYNGYKFYWRKNDRNNQDIFHCHTIWIGDNKINRGIDKKYILDKAFKYLKSLD